MDIGALLLGVISLVLALLDARKRTAPERAEAERHEAVDEDFHTMDRALADRDGVAIGGWFERERREAIKRGAVDHPADHPGGGWLP